MIEFQSKKPKLAINFDDPECVEITFIANKSYAPELQEIKDDATLTIQVKTKTRKRSLSQNAYLWVLLDEIAKKIDRTKTDVYREYIRDYGVFEIIPIKVGAIESFKAKWEKNGLGWICDDLGESKVKGYQRLVAFFGTSSYNTTEMKRILDAVVRDCEEMGINTMPMSDILLLENENDL